MRKDPDVDADDRRVHTRHPVMWSGTLSAETAFDRYRLDCTIRNVSISGVHVLVDREVAAESAVTLKIRGVGEFRGRVARADGDSLGVRFDDAPEAVAELIKKKL